MIKEFPPFVQYVPWAFELCENLPTDFTPDMAMVSSLKKILNIAVVKPKLESLAGVTQTDELMKVLLAVDATLEQPAVRHVEGLRSKLLATVAKLQKNMAPPEIMTGDEKLYTFYNMTKMSTLKAARSACRVQASQHRPHTREGGR